MELSYKYFIFEIKTIHYGISLIFFFFFQVYKLVCNHVIPADFELKPKTDKAFCWSALNYCPEKSDDQPVSEYLSIKFKDEILANKFKKAIEDCLKSLRGKFCFLCHLVNNNYLFIK